MADGPNRDPYAAPGTFYTPSMPAEVTIDDVRYTVTKLDSGNILVEFPNGQYNPMHGPGTDGTHAFEVHPCQRHQYEFWREQLPEEERSGGGPGKDGAAPPWSLRKARTDTSTESTANMLNKNRMRK